MIDNFGNKRNINGFDKRPRDAKKGGRPVSIKKEIEKLLKKDGSIEIPKGQVIKVKKDGSVILKIPTKEQAALKMLQWAFTNSNKGADMLVKLQEMIDGKPNQNIDMKYTENLEDLSSQFTDEELEALQESASKLIIEDE